MDELKMSDLLKAATRRPWRLNGSKPRRIISEHGSDYIAINAIGDKIASFRNDGDSAIVVAFGSHSNPDCGEAGSLSVTVQKKGFEATSEALRLGDAILLARGKVNRMIEADLKRREEEKEKLAEREKSQ